MNLQHRQTKIQEKRKQTPWRDFVMEMAGWRPLNFYKNQGFTSRYPVTNRVGNLISIKDLVSTEQYEGVYRGNFLEAFRDMRLQTNTPAARQVGSSENAEYADMIHSGKNIYLSIISIYNCEDILYSFSTRESSKNVYNSVMVFDHSENIYQSSGIIASYNIFYSKYIVNSNNIWFSSNCIGCSECINCNDLSNQSYCIDNKNLSKEEYLIQKAKILASKIKYDHFYNTLSSQGINYGSTATNGSFVVNSDVIDTGYFSYNTSSSRNIFFTGGKDGNEHLYDVFVGGAVMGKHIYGCQGAGNSEHIYCSAIINDSTFLYYCIGCVGCSFCLGCTRLQNKSYCILNKQYTKEEWYEKVDEIFSSMDKDGTLGQFFPASMNPFYFNDTAAYLIDSSFTKEEVTAKGYLWRDEPIKVDIPDWMEVVESKDLGEYEGWKDLSSGMIVKDLGDSSTGSEGRKWYIDPAILKKTIRDDEGNVYRVIKLEYDFLMKYGLPLPRKHWLERMKENFRIG